jgi:hypothetical protein
VAIEGVETIVAAAVVGFIIPPCRSGVVRAEEADTLRLIARALAVP